MTARLSVQSRSRCAATPASAQGGLQRLLDAATADFPGRAGIWVKHLTTGEEAATRASETFNSASVIKIPVLVLAFQMADRGALNLDERIEIRKDDVRGGSGIFRYHDPGLRPTLRDVLLQMVITSDNTATDLAIAKVGGVARVNAWLAEQGFDRPEARPDHRRPVREVRGADARRRSQRQDQQRSRLLAGRDHAGGDGPHDRGHREEDHRLGRELRGDAAHDARAASRSAAPQPLPASARRAQDRRLPAGAGQRCRHHLRALGPDRRGIPRQRDSGLVRRGRGQDRPLRAAAG